MTREAGGHGESSTFSAEPPWPDARGKIVGRYLAAFIAAVDRETQPQAVGG